MEAVRDDPLRPLLERFRRDGDAAAMEELVSRTRRKLLGVAGRIGARQDAEDSVQAAYHALLVRAELPDAPLLPWLMTTVIRIAYRRKATAQRESKIADHLTRPRRASTPADKMARDEVIALLRRAVAQLPDKYRNPLVLYHLEELSSAETARLLEIPQSTVTTRLQRGRSILRSRLGPTLAGGFMFLPWLFLDGGRALAGAGAAPIGGAMQAKTGTLMAAVGLVAGSAGLLVGSTALSASDSAPRANNRAQHRVTELMLSIAERDEEIVELRHRLQGSRPLALEAAPREPGATPGAGPVMTIFEPSREKPYNRDRARKAAKGLGVTEDQLQIAIEAYDAVRNNADPTAQRSALAALAGLGEASTRAAVAMLRGVEQGGLSGRSVRAVMESALVEGQEHLYIDILKDDVSTAWIKNAVLRNIDLADSPVVRDYLLERFRDDEDRYFSAGVVMALGRMKEERAVPLIRETLVKSGNWVAFDIYSIMALGKIGGPESEAVLVDYLRREKLVHVDRAIAALAKIDPSLARGEASALLNRPDASQLPATTLELLRQLAGRSK